MKFNCTGISICNLVLKVMPYLLRHDQPERNRGSTYHLLKMEKKDTSE
jgi:hypothetical protein